MIVNRGFEHCSPGHPRTPQVSRLNEPHTETGGWSSAVSRWSPGEQPRPSRSRDKMSSTWRIKPFKFGGMMLFIFIWDSLFEASRQCFLPDRVATYSRGDRCWPHESSLASCQALAHCRCLKTPLAWTTGSLGSVEETDLTVPKIQLVGGVNPSQNPNKNESHPRIFIIWQPLLVPAIHTVSRKPHRFMELDSSPPISLAGSNIALAGKNKFRQEASLHLLPRCLVRRTIQARAQRERRPSLRLDGLEGVLLSAKSDSWLR